MSSSRKSLPSSKPTTVQRRHEIADYIDSLFGDEAGWVACALGVGGHYEGKSYSFRSLQKEFFLWPEERSDLIAWALENRKNYDILINPILRAEDSRSAKGDAWGRYAWCDVDIDLSRYSHIQRELDELLPTGSMVVLSGGRGGIHLYVALDGWYPGEVIEEVNRAIRDYINWRAGSEVQGKADNVWKNNGLLRLVGTLNMKGRAKGERGYPVRFDDDEYTRAPWTPEALLKQLRVPSSPVKAKKATRGKGGASTPSPSLTPVQVVDLPFDLPPALIKLTRFYKPKGKDKSRSAQLYGLMAAAVARGLSDDELFLVGRQSEPARERAMERGGHEWQKHLDRDIDRCITALRVDHDHAGLTCGEAGCQTGDPLIIGQTQEMWEHSLIHYRPDGRTLTTDWLVFGVFISIARQIGELEVDMSIRRLADLAARSPNTVWKALRRIIKAGYLMKQDEAHRGRNIPPARCANTYHLNWAYGEGTTHTTLNTPTTNPVAMCINFDDFGHDALRYTALGNAFATYHSLERGLATVEEISAFTGFANQTVGKHLKKLEAHQLAERKSDGTWISHRRSWDEVAEELGTKGVRELKKRIHLRERAEHRAELQQWVIDESHAWKQRMSDRGFVHVRGSIYVPGPNASRGK